jgi:hypothetical protein
MHRHVFHLANDNVTCTFRNMFMQTQNLQATFILKKNTTNVFFSGEISHFLNLKKMISMHTYNLCEKNGRNLTNFKVYFLGITKFLE